MKLPIVIRKDGIEVPTRAYPGDAGLDLQAAHDEVIPPGDRRVVGTGICVEIAPGHVGLILPRSGHAAKFGITHLDAPGVIDSEYRGELHFILFNSDRHDEFLVNFGDRLGQLVIVAIVDAVPTVVNGLSDSERGERGLGSSR